MYSFSSSAGRTTTLVPIGGYIVDFEATPLSGTVPLTVQFTDLSTIPNIISWEWDFDGDGIAESTDQNPIWTYSDAGVYTVSLKIYFRSINQSKTKIDYVIVSAEVITARFIEMDNPTYGVSYYTPGELDRTNISLFFTFITKDQNNNLYISGNFNHHYLHSGTPFIVKYNSNMELQWYIEQPSIATGTGELYELWNEHRQLIYDTNLNKLYSFNLICELLQSPPYDTFSLVRNTYTDDGIFEDQVVTIITEYETGFPVAKDPYISNVFVDFDSILNTNDFYIIRESTDSVTFQDTLRIVKLDSNGIETSFQYIVDSNEFAVSIPDNLGNIYYIPNFGYSIPETTLTVNKMRLSDFSSSASLVLSGMTPYTSGDNYQHIKMAFNSNINNLYIVATNSLEEYSPYTITSNITIKITNANLVTVLKTITCGVISPFALWAFFIGYQTPLESISDIAIDDDNNFYVVTTLYDMSTNTDYALYTNNIFVVIIKFNSNGDKIWERSIKTNRVPIGQDVLTDYAPSYGTSVSTNPATLRFNFWSNTETNKIITCTDTDFILCLSHRNGNFINDEYIDDKEKVASGLMVRLPLDGSLTGDYGEGAFTYYESNYITVT